MTTAYTSLLGLALPVTGELSGTWGDTVNTAITSLLDTAIAGTTSITTDADITLSTTTGASNQARQAIILWNPASGTTTRNITAPAQSKIYTVINASGGTQSIVIRGVGPTTGVTIAKGESATVAWNGTDFVKVSTSGGPGTFTNLTVTGTTTLSGLTASTALALDASKNVVSVTNTGTGNNVLSASPTLTGTIAGASLSLSSLTSGRITYAGASGLLSDSANLTYPGGVLTISNTGGRSVSATGTSALFASASAAHTLLIGDQNYAYFQFYTPASPTYLAIQYNGVEKMRIEAINGNIGLGGQSPPPNTVYPGLFLNYTTNLIPIGGVGGLYYNIYGVGTQLKWQTSSLGGSSFTFGPSSFVWSINGTGGTVDTNAALTQYMQLNSTGLAVVGSVTASSLTSGRVTYATTGGLLTDSANLTFSGSALAVTGSITATSSVTGATTANNAIIANSTFVTAATLGLLTLQRGGTVKGYVGISSTEQGPALIDINGAVRAEVITTGLAVTGTLSASTSISTGLYSVPSTNVGIARQSATDALEIKGTGGYTARFNNDTSTSLGGALQISSNGVAYASTSAFMVQGFTYTSDFSIANATAQIIGTRMTNDTWNPTLNIVTARQSLTTGSLSFGGIGFSTIDASNSAGMRDGARIAIINESTSAVASPTAMAFYTNVGSATQTFPATEAGRFNSSGSLLLGTISNSTGARLNVVGSRAARFESTQANVGGILTQCNSSNNDEPAVSASNINTSGSGLVTLYSSLGGTGASNTNCFHLKAITQGSAIYYLYGNGTSSFTSDARLKKNITTTRDGYAEDLCKLRVVKYNWNGAPEGEAQELGLIAQEVEQVFPNLVIDAADEIQGIKPKVLKASVLPFMLLKALQEQQAIIESLKARLDAANL